MDKSLLSSRHKNYEKDQQGFMIMTPYNLNLLCIKDDLYEQPYLNSKLYLHYQGFKKIENLEEYKNLKTLWLENNCLTKIENIGHLQELNSLFLHNNQIQKIENLENLANLSILKLQHNIISKIEGLECCRFLQNLDISSNQLNSYESIEGLLECPSLTNINISENQIEKDERILGLFKKMPELACLYSKGNPYQRETKFYRKTYIVEIEGLKYLDDRPITVEEREICMAWKEGGREGEFKKRQEINEKKKQFHRDYVRDIGDKQKKVKQARLKLFQNSLERKKKEIAEMEERLQQWVQEGMHQMNIDSLSTQIKEEQEKVKGLKETIENLNMFVAKGNSMIAVTRTEEGEIIVHNKSKEEADRIKREHYKEETEEFERKQRLKQPFQAVNEEDENKDIDNDGKQEQIVDNQDLQNKFVFKDGKIEYSRDFDELLEVLLQQNNFDFDKTLVEMQQLLSQIEKKDVQINFDAEVLQQKWEEIEKRQMNSSQQSTVDLDELD